MLAVALMRALLLSAAPGRDGDQDINHDPVVRPVADDPVIPERVEMTYRLGISREDGERILDSWWAYSLGIFGILFPIFLALLVAYLAKARFEWQPVTSQIDNGTFLLPITILCFDTIWRLTYTLRRPRGRVLKVVRLVAAALCVMAAFTCLFAVCYTQSILLTPQARDVITTVTICTLALSVISSTLAVFLISAPAWEHRSDNDKYLTGTAISLELSGPSP